MSTWLETALCSSANLRVVVSLSEKFEVKFLTQLGWVVSGAGEIGWVDVVVGGGGVEVRVLEPDGVCFEWLLLIVDMYLPVWLSLLLLSYGLPPVFLCCSLLNLAFWHSMILLCLATLTLFMKGRHSLR